ncbi:glycine zipper domain-containing protein [Nitrospira sp. NS4]|uniref:glycine zipper domain-containing protein n=1 Tax=Nitrospira sp. NS4 TaxID=3414498 RepID=UPI003C2EDBCE
MADSNITINLWKLSTIGLLGIGATVLVTTFVLGQKHSVETGLEAKVQPQTAPAQKVQRASNSTEHARPSQTVIEACNRYANEQMTDKTTEVAKDAGIGAVLGAAVGAAGGAIADGGKGAGKGAAIGGIVGATGGTLYGLNENKTSDERYKVLYTSCLRSKGYSA